MSTHPERIKEYIRSTADLRGDGFIGFVDMKELLQKLVPHLSDTAFLSLAQSSGACFVKYSQLIDGIFGKESVCNSTKTCLEEVGTGLEGPFVVPNSIMSKLPEEEDDTPTNSAFVFIKPHAVTEKVKALAKAGLQSSGIKILSEGSLPGKTIDEKKLIDQHYYSIASKATLLKPQQLNVPADKFESQFGIGWQAALDSGKVFNAMDGCEYLGIDADRMDAEWTKAKKAKKLIKFGGGFYCGLLELEGKEPVYVFNGFFMSMRSKFTAPGTQIYYYSVQWDSEVLSWANFRSKVLGPTDPGEAPKESLRGQILAKWQDLGLNEPPNVGDNGMHASASPFEGIAERNNWLGTPIKDDPFGKLMLEAGLTEERIKEWSVDPQVRIDQIEGDMGSVFDQLEDLDAPNCLDKLVYLSHMNQQESARRSKKINTRVSKRLSQMELMTGV